MPQNHEGEGEIKLSVQIKPWEERFGTTEAKQVEKESFGGIWASLKLPVCSFTTPERQLGKEEDLTAQGTRESAS